MIKSHDRKLFFRRAFLFLCSVAFLGGCHYPAKYTMVIGYEDGVSLAMKGSLKPFRLDDGLRVTVCIGAEYAQYYPPFEGFEPFGFSVYLNAPHFDSDDFWSCGRYFLEFFTVDEFLSPSMADYSNYGIWPFEREYLVDGDWISEYAFDLSDDMFRLLPSIWAVGKGESGEIMMSRVYSENLRYVSYVRSDDGLFRCAFP